MRSIRGWQLWTLDQPLKGYLVGVIALASVATAVALVQVHSRAADIAVYLGLLGCGLVTIESGRSMPEVKGAVTRDLQTVWYLAIAITLPPAFALLAPLPLAAYRLWRVRQPYAYRRVFSHATISLAYGSASLVFHSARTVTADRAPGVGIHALAWTGLVVCCGILAWVINNGLLLVAIRLADPGARFRDLFGLREGIVYDLIEFSLAVPLTLVVAINPVLIALALPSVVLYRRYLMHAQFFTHARIDQKTGMLNARAWQHEAGAMHFRAARSRAPLALLIVAVDHFESVRATAGPHAADQVLHSIGSTLAETLLGYGLIGRFGREEFAVLLPRTGRDEARRVGERLRDHIAGEPVAIEDGSHAGFVFRLTVSIGIAVLDQSWRPLAELIGAAGTALSAAKTTGQNKVCVMPPTTSDLGPAERV